MRVVVARCTVRYEGRLESVLSEAVRLIMVKSDGCVAVHADSGAYKPLNWMNAPNTLAIGDDEWTVTNPKGEVLRILIHELFSDVDHDLGIEPGLDKDGVEAQLQVLLAERTDVIEPGMTLVRREFPTALGPVDLLCKADDGQTVAVEISAAATSTGSNNWLDTLKNSTAIRESLRCEGYSLPKRSSHKPKRWPIVAVFHGLKLTMTSYEIGQATSCACSDSLVS